MPNEHESADVINAAQRMDENEKVESTSKFIL